MPTTGLNCTRNANERGPEAPLVRSADRTGSGQALDDHGHALAAADAHRLDAERLVRLLEAVDQGGHDAGTGHAERVTEGDRPTVDVELVVGDAEVTGRRDDLGGERLVDLEQVDVVDGLAGTPQRLLDGLDRAE